MKSFVRRTSVAVAIAVCAGTFLANAAPASAGRGNGRRATTTTTTSATPTVIAGTYSVPAQIPSDCSRPVDRELASFLATVPDGSTIKFPLNGCYGQHDTLWIQDRKNLTFEGNGSTLKIVTTSLNATWFRSSVRIRRGSGITLRNLTIVGACVPGQCQNGTPPPQPDGYGQHGIALDSTASPTLDNVDIRDVLSDGVAVQGTLDPNVGWSGNPTSNLVIINSTIERAGRQLIGITNLDGAVISDNLIRNGPQTGIDVEVDHPGFVARHIKIQRNTFENIHAQAFANGGIGSDPLVGDILIENNIMSTDACAGSIWIRTPGPATPTLYRSGYTVRGNRISLIGWFLQAERVKGLHIENNITDFTEVGCGEKAAVELFDSHTVTLAGNDFSGYPAPIWADSLST